MSKTLHSACEINTIEIGVRVDGEEDNCATSLVSDLNSARNRDCG